MKKKTNLVRVRLLTDGYFRDSDNLKVWLKPRTFPVIVNAEIVKSESGLPVFAKVPMSECVAIGMNPAIFGNGLEGCGLSWALHEVDDLCGNPEAEIL
ncbi:hypothetical protein FDJ47_gp38 [Enterobacter phage Ec_L1]|uniref:Uncharacterized protein n=1 Tax=Enterobacter phage Ec_L1 TaxID=2070180 RepID=A0A2P0W9W1_9CAUD|nr:hypothetical protein FDJ47_gp38 [Enterobacter phage Ec_L1]AUV57152.1 hypothetical protein Ec38 [Enterobacter phage Ec_L1]